MRVEKGIPKGNKRNDYDYDHLRRREALFGVGNKSMTDSSRSRAGSKALPDEEAASEEDDDEDDDDDYAAVYLLSSWLWPMPSKPCWVMA